MTSPRAADDACEDVDVVIVGAGFGGLGMAIALQREGRRDFVIVEQADGVGGTWRANHYPGAACDIESHLYSFSFAPNPDWSRTYAPQAEILGYLERLVARHGLGRHLRLGTTVLGAELDAASGRWRVRTSDQRTLAARALVVAAGGLSRPALPDLPGLADFAGPAFHSARWDHATPLAGRKVGVIGTGASAIQIVPELARVAGRLSVFQRSAPWILPKDDRPIAPEERERFRRAPWRQRLARGLQFVRHELTTSAFVPLAGPLQLTRPLLGVARRQALEHLRTSVADPTLRQRLTPDYAIGCKRILLSNDYYPALQAPHVDLVTAPIARVVADGILTRDGTLHRLDALVLATGFHAADVAAPFPVRGRDGRDLAAVWAEGAEAYLGTVVSGFPNLFMIVGPNTGLGSSSMVLMIEAQVRYIASALELLRARGPTALLDVRPEVQRRYNDDLQARLAHTVWASGCRSWYLAPSGRNTTLWPSFTLDFRWRTRAARPSDFTA